MKQPTRRLNRAKPHRRPSAVALSYDADTMPAPTVTASGQGEVAERIVALAKAHGVAIRQDPDLVALLAQLDIGQTIPPELYAVVAEVLAFVYQLKAKHPPKATKHPPS